jgi:hypothetical protein
VTQAATLSLPLDTETKTIAHNMGCGVVIVEQYDPTTKRNNSVVLTEGDLASLATMVR